MAIVGFVIPSTLQGLRKVTRTTQGQSLTGQTLELLGFLQNFLVSVASVHKSHTITDLNVQHGVDLSVPPGRQRPRHIIQQQKLAIHHCPTNIHSTTLHKNNGVETERRRNNQPLIEVRDTPLWNLSVFSLCTANELVSSTWKDTNRTV